jgi:hypothetical protein
MCVYVCVKDREGERQWEREKRERLREREREREKDAMERKREMGWIKGESARVKVEKYRGTQIGRITKRQTELHWDLR